MENPLKGVEFFINGIPIGGEQSQSVKIEPNPMPEFDFEGEIAAEDMTFFDNFIDGDVIDVTVGFGPDGFTGKRKCRVTKHTDGSVSFQTVD